MKHVIVTGASKGIGLETALSFQRAGYSVVATARNESSLKAAFKGLENVHIMPWDMSDIDSISDYSKKVFEITGPITGLVHCAGMKSIVPIHMLKKKKIEEVFDLNCFSSMVLVSNFAKKGRTEEGASFVLISSISAREGVVGATIYSASKAAIEGFTVSSAPELCDKNIRINCIAPGTIETPMTDEYFAQLTDQQTEDYIKAYPLGLGKPDDIANFAKYLVSDDGKWITGQIFTIDGGHFARKS